MKNKKINFALVATFTLAICGFCIGLNLPKASANIGEVQVEEIYTLNDNFTAPEMKITVDGTEYVATAILKYPSGNLKNAKNVILDEAGKYTLEYKLLKNDKLYSKEYYFVVNDEVYSTSGKGTSYYGKHDYLGDVEGRVVTLPKGSVFRYNKILNVSDLTQRDTLIKFYILPATVGIADVNRITVRLTDVYDENNYVNIVSKDGSASSLLNVANASGQTETGCEECSSTYSGNHPVIDYNGKKYKKFPGNQYGTSSWGSAHLNGKPSLGSISTNYVAFHFDYAEKSLYNRPNFLICDLDDTAFFTKPWRGFTTGEVFLTIEASGYSSESVTLMVTDIYGADMSDNVSVDDDAPSISVDTSAFDGLTIEGVTNEKFKVFSAVAKDINDGDVIVEKEVYYDYFNKKISVGIEDDCFVPQKPGVYTIEYSASDRAGNRVVKAINVIVPNKSDVLDISFGDSFDVDGFAGQSVTVKNYSLINAHGKAQCKIYAESYENSVRYEINDGKFLPIYAGKYKVVYEYSDYIYDKSVFYDVEIKGTNKPYLNTDMVYVYDYYVKNKEYNFIDAEGYSFTDGKPFKEKIYVAVYNDGKADYENIYESTESFSVNAEQSIRFRYFTVNSGIIKDVNKIDFSNTDNIDYRDFTAEVIDVGYKSEQTGEETLNLSKFFDAKNFRAGSSDEGILFSNDGTALNESAYIKFINGIYFSGFSINLKFLNNAEKEFSVKFSDFETKRLVYKVDYRLNADTVFAKVNNGETEYFAPINGNLIFLKFDVDNESVTLCNGISVDFDKAFDGSDLSGYINKKLYFEIEFADSSKAEEFLITEIANQKMTYNAIDDVPPIVFGIDISGRSGINKEYTVKPAYAYDVISPVVKFTLMVTDPDGEFVKDVDGNVLRNADPTVERKIVFDKYGDYYFYYLASDGSLANPVRATRLISVIDDETPVIELGEKKLNYKKGDKVKVASFSVKDNVTKEFKTYIYVVYELNTTVVENGEFVATKAGKYTINYFCSDEQGNWSFVSYEITVE